jgi:hypothetical protein
MLALLHKYYNHMKSHKQTPSNRLVHRKLSWHLKSQQRRGNKSSVGVYRFGRFQGTEFTLVKWCGTAGGENLVRLPLI